MATNVTTPLLQEAQSLLGKLPKGGIKKFAEQLGWSLGRVRQIAKGVQPTGSRSLGSGYEQVQRVVYELRKMGDAQQDATAFGDALADVFECDPSLKTKMIERGLIAAHK